MEDASGNRTAFGYDPATGRKTWEMNALDKYTRYLYNDQGQVTHIWGDSVYPVQYEYDGYGQRTKMHTFQGGTGWNGATWPATGTGDITTWYYDEATGLLAGKEDAAGKMVTYTYTAAGQLKTRTWARSKAGITLSTTYIYDPKTSELTAIDYSDTTVDVHFTYDRLGRQETITDAVGVRTFTYNGALQLDYESITGLYDKTITRNYDALGRSSGFTADADYTTTYDYEPATGRLNSVSWDVGGVTGNTTYGYLPHSNLLQSATFGSGQVTTYGYEPNRNLKTRVANQFGAALISQYDYSYDAIGRRENVQNSGSAFTESGFNLYGYNDRNELTASERYLGMSLADTGQPVTEETRGYGYDNIGNRASATDWDAANSVQMSLTYTANQVNQYDLISSSVGPDSIPLYDDDGNMTGYGNRVYTYNAENRLVAVDPAIPAEGDSRLEFVYDYLGRRVQKQVFAFSSGAWLPTSNSSFLYDGWNMIAELDDSGQPTASYVYGLDLSQSMQGAGGIGGLLTRVDAGGDYTYSYDANGNVAQMVDSAGNIAAHYEYDPFGNTVNAAGTLAETNPYRFSTKYFDNETGLYYYGNRYYLPELGRWLTRDPIAEKGGLNLYGFVENRPTGQVDKLGLAVYVAYRRMANSLSFLWDLGRRGGHVYLVFDEEFEENAERCCWDQLLNDLNIQFTAPFTFSFHPESVVNPESNLDRKTVLVTDGSAVDINNLINDIEPYLDGRAEHWQITNDPCEQAAIFRRAFISAGRHNECGSCADQFGHYSGSYKNCGGWAKYIIEGAGAEWPPELSREINSGAGVDGPMQVPGMMFYGASRAVAEMEPVEFTSGNGETAIYPGWTFELP